MSSSHWVRSVPAPVVALAPPPRCTSDAAALAELLGPRGPARAAAPRPPRPVAKRDLRLVMTLHVFGCAAALHQRRRRCFGRAAGAAGANRAAAPRPPRPVEVLK